jgi:hypothetical protein
MNTYTMQFNLILSLRQFQIWSIFCMLSGEFNASKNSTNWISPNGWNSKEKDGLSTLSFEGFLPSTDFKLLQTSKTKLLVETFTTQTSSTSSTTSTSSLKPTSKSTKMNFLMTNFLLKAFDLKYLTPPQLTMTLTKDLQFYQSLQQQPSDQLPEPEWRL